MLGKVDHTKGIQKKAINVFIVLGLSIFVSEAIIMLLLGLFPHFTAVEEAIIDAAFLALLIFPVIYFLLFKPLQKSIVARINREAKYEALIENMGEGVIFCDENEVFVFANRAAEEIFGMKNKQLGGLRLDLFFSPENFNKILDQTAERKKGISSGYESEIILKDGSTKKIFINAVPQFEDAQFTGTLAILRDVSELKKAEEAINYERNLLRSLIDTLPDSIYFKDSQGKKIIANPIDLQYMGFQREEEVIGKDDDEIYPKEVAESSREDDQKVLTSGIPQLNKEDYFIDNNGQEHWMHNSKVPIKNSAGEIIGLVGIGREITERKKEETRLKLLESVITNATDGVIITSINDKEKNHYQIIFVNAAYCKMTGYTPEEVKGKSPALLQGEKTNKAELVRIRESLKRFEPCQTELINYKKDGTEFWSSIAFFPISDNTGKYTHWIAIKRDVTDQKILELNYIKAKENAEAASKAKSEFLANMSHEIRTPLNSVIGFSDLMMKMDLNATQRHYINAVFQSANSLLDIINEILDFSKIEAGKMEAVMVKTDLIDLCNQTINIISFQAFKKNLELLLNIGNDIPRFIVTDQVMLRQVLINLMGNAVKFTATGEVELKIELLEQKSSSLAMIRFAVRDTGIGIQIENQQKIFEAFSQEDASTNRKFGGTGLGLTISKRMLMLMGSELRLESKPGFGSTFSFDMELETMIGEKENWNIQELYKNVLIVDDNSNNRLLIRDMLALEGVKSEEAENGKQALALLKNSKKFDIILMDFNMPGMDGLETIQHIREDLQLNADKQPIALLHSSAEDGVVNNGCEKWNVAFRLVKPIRMNQLFGMLSTVRSNSTSSQPSPSISKEKEDFLATLHCKVLLADDNELNRLLIGKIVSITMPKAEIREAKNGKIALEMYQQFLPDIIFMDVQMPEMNGNQATEAIRKLEKGNQLPIIALTAGTQADEKELSMQAGMNDFVTKPFVSAVIKEVLYKWLHKI